jgi:hypothetical protein
MGLHNLHTHGLQNDIAPDVFDLQPVSHWLRS